MVDDVSCSDSGTKVSAPVPVSVLGGENLIEEVDVKVSASCEGELWLTLSTRGERSRVRGGVPRCPLASDSALSFLMRLSRRSLSLLAGDRSLARCSSSLSSSISGPVMSDHWEWEDLRESVILAGLGDLRGGDSSRVTTIGWLASSSFSPLLNTRGFTRCTGAGSLGVLPSSLYNITINNNM